MASIDPLASLTSLLDTAPEQAVSSNADDAVATFCAPRKLDNPVLICCGVTEFENAVDVKLKAKAKQTALFAPHRLVGTALDGIKVRNIISGGTSCHVVALTDAGVFTWGKNHRGQLGLGDDVTRNGPVEVVALKKKKIVHAATGKGHTVFITDGGEVYACGDNKFGAVGPTPKIKQEMAMLPVLVPGITNAVFAACGADFSMVLTKSKVLYSFGWSEYGQLGHGTDGCFNKSASSIKLSFEAERKPSIVTGMKNVVQVACGTHHCVALQDDGVAFTWGCGGYGRLGHLDQADQWSPKELPNFKFRYVCCGNQWTFGIGWRLYNADQKPNGNGMMHIWGQMNSNKDSGMYPKPEYDLQGWDIELMSCGNSHAVVCADGSCIAWGSGTSLGELGFGDLGPKSSAKPKKVDSLEGADVGAVCTGFAHTMYLCEASDEIAALSEFTPLPNPEPVAGASDKKDEKAAKGKGKRAGGAAEPKTTKAAAAKKSKK